MDCEIEEFIKESRNDAIRLSRRLLSGDCYFLDTETTGLDKNAQIIEIAICDKWGDKVYESLINPGVEIPEQATKIHGITNDDIIEAPTPGKVYRDLEELFEYHNLTNVVIYNSDYDIRLMAQTFERYSSLASLSLWEAWNIECAMQIYSWFWGQYDSVSGLFGWQKLTAAIDQCRIGRSFGKAHRALSDCRMTAAIIHHMAFNGGE